MAGKEITDMTYRTLIVMDINIERDLRDVKENGFVCEYEMRDRRGRLCS
jgi:hypothetical protein